MFVFNKTLGTSENSTLEERPSDHHKPSSKKRKCCRTEEVAKRAKKCSANILDLPDEILLKIFLELPKNDTFFNVNVVCKRWNDLVKDKTLRWKKIEVGRESSKRICKWILSAPFLEHLALNDRKDLDKILIDLYKNCKNFKTLEVRNCRSSRALKLFDSISLCKLFRTFLGQLRFENMYVTKTVFWKLLLRRSFRSNMRKFIEWSRVSKTQFRIFLTLDIEEWIAVREAHKSTVQIEFRDKKMTFTF